MEERENKRPAGQEVDRQEAEHLVVDHQENARQESVRMAADHQENVRQEVVLPIILRQRKDARSLREEEKCILWCGQRL